MCTSFHPGDIAITNKKIASFLPKNEKVVLVKPFTFFGVTVECKKCF